MLVLSKGMVEQLPALVAMLRGNATKERTDEEVIPYVVQFAVAYDGDALDVISQLVVCPGSAFHLVAAAVNSYLATYHKKTRVDSADIRRLQYFVMLHRQSLRQEILQHLNAHQCEVVQV